MLETSQDVLYLIVALCVLIFTGFLSWMMYYLAQILRQSNDIIAEVRIKLDELNEAITNIKEKVSSSASTIALVATQIKDIVSFVQSRKEKKRKK